MRALIQRVKNASVTVEGKLSGEIGRGLLIFLGVTHNDGMFQADYLAEKIANLRIFNDEAGKMNRSLLDIGGSALVVSQFTLYGDCRKGRRPGFSDAALPENAELYYKAFMKYLIEPYGVLCVESGIFGAEMSVKLENDGPVTFMLESIPEKNS